jgi:hypothetical protein
MRSRQQKAGAVTHPGPRRLSYMTDTGAAIATSSKLLGGGRRHTHDMTATPYCAEAFMSRMSPRRFPHNHPSRDQLEYSVTTKKDPHEAGRKSLSYDSGRKLLRVPDALPGFRRFGPVLALLGLELRQAFAFTLKSDAAYTQPGTPSRQRQT